MNTSLLYHGFGLIDQEYQSVDYAMGKIWVKVKTKDDKLQCSNCKSWNVIKSGIIERVFRTLPIGSKDVRISAQIQRLECKDCGMIRQEHIKFADQKKTYTNSFRRYILELCHFATINDIARHLGISWDVVKEIHKTYLGSAVLVLR
jgi:transposase